MNNGQMIISPLFNCFNLTLSLSAIFIKTKRVVSGNYIKSIFHIMV